MLYVLKKIDAHVAGEPLRLVAEGLPWASGKTMAQKRDCVIISERRVASYFSQVLQSRSEFQT